MVNLEMRIEASALHNKKLSYADKPARRV